MTDEEAAELYRLAVANKMIRLGLVRLDEEGEMEATPALYEMDMQIGPDDVDYCAIRRRRRRAEWVSSGGARRPQDTEVTQRLSLERFSHHGSQLMQRLATVTASPGAGCSGGRSK